MKLPDDPFVLELLPEFVDTWIQDIDTQFNELIKNCKGDDLYRFGHTLKGSCFQFGLDEIAAFGIEIMGYAKNLEWDKAALLEPKIKDLFVNVKKYLETVA